MKQFIQASAFTVIAVTSSVAWGQAAPDLYDSTGKAIGQYKGDSVVIPYSNQTVRVYLDNHWDYGAGRPLSSGVTWKYVPVYYATPDCTGQAYIGSGAGTPAGTPPSTATGPAYGSQYVVAPNKQGNQWTAYVSAANPTYTQYPLQSERQYDGSCAAKSQPSLWTTPVQTTVPLNTYGTPPFYIR